MFLKQCHLCLESQGSLLAQCSNKRCKYAFCTSCIVSSFNPQFQMQLYKKECWVCFVCSKVCKCNLCNGQIPDKRRRTVKSNPEDQKQVTSLTSILQISKHDPSQQLVSSLRKTKFISKHSIKRQAIRSFFLKSISVKFVQTI